MQFEERQAHCVRAAAGDFRVARLILVARREGRLVGGFNVSVSTPGHGRVCGNVSRRAETRIRQDDLLLWRGIECPVEQGSFGYFSMAGAHVAATLHAVALRTFHPLPESVRRRTRKLLQQPIEAD